MTSQKPITRRWRKNIRARLENWLPDKLENDEWANHSYRDIAHQIGMSHYAVYQHLPSLVAEMTGRTAQAVRAVRDRRSKQSYSTPFVHYCIQQFHQTGRSIEAIASLVGCSDATTRGYTHAPCVELPSDTGGWKISDELRQVLADELGIGISPDGTTHKLDEASEQDHPLAENSGAPSISTAGDQPTQTKGFKINAAPREDVSNTTINTDTGHPLSNRQSSVPHDKDAQLPDIVIYIVQQLYSKGYSIDGILREEKLNLTKAQVLKCLDHRTVGLPDHIDPYYESVMNQRQLYPTTPTPREFQDDNRFFWGDTK